MNASNSRSRLFLLELILALLIFSICSAVCAGLFARSYSLTQDSSKLNEAVFLAESCAEAFHISTGPSMLAEILGATAIDRYSCRLFYDADWQAVSSVDEALYILNIALNEEGKKWQAHISVAENDALIYELATMKCVPEVIAQ